jgi:hypothetical protein
VNVHAGWRMAVAMVEQSLNPQIPTGLPERLGQLSAPQTADALQAAETLLTDTVQLAETHTDADLTSFRAELSEKRRSLDPPLSR